MGASRGSRYQQDAGRRALAVTGMRSGTGIVIGVLVALLILFWWLHFIVAQENESIGREIQAQTEEMARIERENMALRQQIAAAYAEELIAKRAAGLGYRPQQPLYLFLNQPLVPASVGSRTEVLIQPSIFRDASTASEANPVSGAASEGSSTVAGRP